MAKRVMKKVAAPISMSPASPVISSLRTATVSAHPVITEEQIRQRAYEIFLRRNGGPGDSRSDWLQAEAELRSEKTR